MISFLQEFGAHMLGAFFVAVEAVQQVWEKE